MFKLDEDSDISVKFLFCIVSYSCFAISFFILGQWIEIIGIGNMLLSVSLFSLFIYSSMMVIRFIMNS